MASNNNNRAKQPVSVMLRIGPMQGEAPQDAVPKSTGCRKQALRGGTATGPHGGEGCPVPPCLTEP